MTCPRPDDDACTDATPCAGCPARFRCCEHCGGFLGAPCIDKDEHLYPCGRAARTGCGGTVRAA